MVSAPSAASPSAPVSEDGVPVRRPRWALPVVVVAVIAVAIAAFVGVRGLTQNPIVGTDAAGVTTMRGTFEPYHCATTCVEGYVQAGARSVFVILPTACSEPTAGTEVTILGRIDRTQGTQTYRATGCATG